MVQDNNWLRFGQNNIVNTLLHGATVWTSPCSLEQQWHLIIIHGMTGWHTETGGCTWRLLMWRGILTLVTVTQCHMSQPHQGPPLNAAEQEEMLGLWPVDPIRGEGVRTQDRGLIKDGTVYGERCLCERLYGVWCADCGEEVRRDEGLWHEVWGCRNVEIGSCKSLSPGGNVCQYLDVSIRDQERAAHWHPAVPDAAVVTRAPLQSLQWVMALQGERPH